MSADDRSYDRATKKLKAENIDVRIVSFSVDPENDKPKQLKKFAANYPLSFDNWDFLTGYSQSDIEAFALKSFKAIVKKPEERTKSFIILLFIW